MCRNHTFHQGSTATQSGAKFLGWTSAAVLGLFMMAAVPASAAKESPPEGRTYFAVFLGLERGAQPSAGCIKFTRTRFCSGEGACGSWNHTTGGVQTRLQSSFDFKFDLLDDEGNPIDVDGQARIDQRGPRHAIAGVARVRADDSRINFGFAGRPVDPAGCVQLAEDFNTLNGID